MYWISVVSSIRILSAVGILIFVGLFLLVTINRAENRLESFDCDYKYYQTRCLVLIIICILLILLIPSEDTLRYLLKGY